MSSAFGLGGLLAGMPCDRAALQAAAGQLRPAREMIDAADLACFQANADLLPDDYASLILGVSDQTSAGKKAKLVRYGVGVACGAVLGVLNGKFVL